MAESYIDNLPTASGSTSVDYSHADEQDLVERCQEGDKAAFNELVSRYERYVFNIIYKHLGNSEHVDDIAQEVFLRIFRFIKSFRQEASIKSWIYKITLNYIRTHLRKQSTINKMVFQPRPEDEENDRDYEVLERMADEDADPADGIVPQKVAEEIREAVYGLKPIYRDVLIMRELKQLSYKEISDVLDIAIGTVKSRISRARELVREELDYDALEFVD